MQPTNPAIGWLLTDEPFEFSPGRAIGVTSDGASSPQESVLLSARELCCVRDGRDLFTGLELRIASGELVALHGANGAGKSTLLRCLAGLYPDYSGTLEVVGFVYAGHKAGLSGHLSAAENLRFLVGLENEFTASTAAYLASPLAPNVSAALAEVGLPGYEDVRCNALSAGQLRRVGLARLLLSRAPLWLLDEPLTALDTAGAELLGRVLQAHVDAGGAALCATHQTLPGINHRSVELTPTGAVAA